MSWAESWARSSPRNRIVLATASVELRHKLEDATDGACLTLPLGPLPATPAELFTHLGAAPRPELIVLDSGADPGPALELASLFDVQCPGLSVVVVNPAAQEIGMDAMRAGVRDIIHPAADESTFRQVLDRAYEAARTRVSESDQATASGPAPAGRVITVSSAKGGVGKTTVATSLAVGLAQTGRNSTVLVDLDLQFGDVASALGLDPAYALPDAVSGLATRDTMVLKTFLTLHETGLSVLCGAKTPAEGDRVSADAVGRLLEMLRSEFAYVVVDTAAGLSDHALAAMDESSDLVLVAGMDVPGVRGLRKELDALTQLGMATNRRSVVLNFVDERAGLTVADVESTLGVSVDLRLPRSPSVLASVNQGVPLLQSAGRRDPVAKQLRELLGRFAPGLPPLAAPKRTSRRAERQQPAPVGRRADPARTPARVTS